MEYNLTDEKVRIENLQKMLRTIFLVTGDAGYEVGISGVYGEGTRNAVLYFQKAHGLPTTGVADLAVWNAIAEEYGRLSPFAVPPCGITPFPNAQNTVVRSGERSDLVYIIQIMLNTLGMIYDFERVPISGFYDVSTTGAVRKYQEINSIDAPGGAVDRLTWNRMAEEYNRMVEYDA